MIYRRKLTRRDFLKLSAGSTAALADEIQMNTRNTTRRETTRFIMASSFKMWIIVTKQLKYRDIPNHIFNGKSTCWLLMHLFSLGQRIGKRKPPAITPGSQGLR